MSEKAVPSGGAAFFFAVRQAWRLLPQSSFAAVPQAVHSQAGQAQELKEIGEADHDGGGHMIVTRAQFAK